MRAGAVAGAETVTARRYGAGVRRLVLASVTALAACAALAAFAALPALVAGPASGAAPAGLVRAPVTRVVDGDTVRITWEGASTRVRLIGIDTPEVDDDRPVVRCLAAAATRRAVALAGGKTVGVELDPSQGRTDKYGRLLAYLWLPDGTMLNERMVAEGYASEYTYDLPYRYRARFRAAQQAARRKGLGLWAAKTACGAQTAGATRRAA